MKILNKISIISVFVMVLTLVTTSCTDDDKDPLNNTLLTSGGFVRFTEQNPPETIGTDNVENVDYSFDLSDANGNVALYELSVAAVLGGGDPTEFFPLTEISSFPVSLTYTIDELTSAIGVNVGDVTFGDKFMFEAVVTTNDGTVYSNEELFFGDLDDDDIDGNVLTGQGVTSDLLDNPGYRQAFEFDFTILCPTYEEDLIAGTYQVVNGNGAGLYSDGDEFQVIVGPGENQYSIVGFGDIDLVLNVIPDSSGATVPSDEIFLTFASGTQLAPVGRESGFAFTCIDKILLNNFEYACCGGFALELDKVSDSTDGIGF